MAHQMLRRPGLSPWAPAALLCRAQVPVLRNICQQTQLIGCPLSLLRPQQQQSAANRRVARLAPCRMAADAEATGVTEQPRSRLLIDTSPEIIEGPEMPELPMPKEYQQTLWSSFTLAGIGLHTAEYACVRVRPAFAGEGRYFVRVAQGTNASRAVAGADMDLQEELVGEMEEEEAVLNDPEYKQELVARYQEYIDAQEEEGFGGSFLDYLNANECTQLVQRLEEQGPPKFRFSEPEAPQPRAEDEPYVPAAAEFICEPNPVTTTLARGELQVAGVESLLSALEACGVDNARIEIEGGMELPVLDGSAEGWTEEICRSGLRFAPTRPDLPIRLPPGALDPPEGAEGEGEEASTSGRGGEGEEEEETGEGEGDAEEVSLELVEVTSGPVPKLVLRPEAMVSVSRGSSFVTLYPEDTFRITVGVDRHVEAPVVGKQWLSWCMWEDVHYRHSLSDARGFVASPQQAMALREAGWLMGGTEGVMLIGLGERWYDPDLVRHDDEPARRQIQDLIGDLSLLARDGHSGLPCGHIVSYNADHELNAAFVEQLRAATHPEGDWVPVRNVAGPSVPVDMQEMMRDVIAEPHQEGYSGEDKQEEEEDAQAGAYEEEDEERDMYSEEEYGGEGEEEGVVDVEATEVDEGKGRGGDRGRR